MIHNFNNFINEELRIDKLDDKSLNQLKLNLMDRLTEYKNSILANIVYNMSTNKVEYKETEGVEYFDLINIDIILRQLNNEFSEEAIKDLNVESFLRKITQILELRKRNTKRKIREEFDQYYNSIEQRMSNISKGDEEDHFDKIEGESSLITKKQYESEKFDLQVELLKLQEWVVKNNKKVAIVFEGRDAAGKGSTIKRFTEYLNPRGFKIVALGLPTDEEKKNWFGRYEKHMPKPGEIAFFDRSWYNRAVVEPALGYCTEEQYTEFMGNVLDWENHLMRDEDIILIKFWFSITKEKQASRFDLRKSSPLKYWKFSPNDAKVIDKWDIIGNYKNQMFSKTSSNNSPWVIVNSNDKKIGRLNAIRYVLSEIDYDGKNEEAGKYYPEVINVIK
jgi:polyphosphate kinase 2